MNKKIIIILVGAAVVLVGAFLVRQKVLTAPDFTAPQGWSMRLESKDRYILEKEGQDPSRTESYDGYISLTRGGSDLCDESIIQKALSSEWGGTIPGNAQLVTRLVNKKKVLSWVELGPRDGDAYSCVSDGRDSLKIGWNQPNQDAERTVQEIINSRTR